MSNLRARIRLLAMIALTLCGALTAHAQTPGPLPTATAGPPPCALCPLVALTLATQVKPTSMVATATHVYFTDSKVLNKQLQVVPVGGGTPTLIWSKPNGSTAQSLITDGSTLFWVAWSTSSAQVYRRPLGFGPEALIFDNQSFNEPTGQALALSGSELAYANSSGNHLYRLTPASLPWTATDVLPQYVPGTQGFYYAKNVLVVGNTVYFTRALPAQGLYKVPLAGGPGTFITSADARSRLASDATYLYYATDDRIKRVSLSGGTAIDVATVTEPPSALLLDGGYIYWACQSCGTVTRLPLAGGIAKTMLSNAFGSPLSLATNASRLFVGLDDKLVSVAK